MVKILSSVNRGDDESDGEDDDDDDITNYREGASGGGTRGRGGPGSRRTAGDINRLTGAGAGARYMEYSTGRRKEKAGYASKLIQNWKKR